MLKQTWMLSLILTLATAAWAGQGGESGGGGGNAKKSTIEEASEFIYDHLPGYTMSALNEIRRSLSPGALMPIKDARASAILSKIIQLPQLEWRTSADGNLVVDEGYFYVNFRRDFKTSGACFDGPNERDASFSMSSIGNRPIVAICFSGERLTRYLYSDFSTQFVALMLHEMAHAAGYGEEDAEYIQDYYLNRFTKKCFMVINLKEGEDDAINPVIVIGLSHDGLDEQPLIEVTYRRYFKQRPGVGVSYIHNEVNVVTYNFAKDFSYEWTPHHGFLQFVMMNSDQTYTKQRITWGESSDGFHSNKILSSNLRFDDRVLKAEFVGGLDCFLR